MTRILDGDGRLVSIMRKPKFTFRTRVLVD